MESKKACEFEKKLADKAKDVCPSMPEAVQFIDNNIYRLDARKKLHKSSHTSCRSLWLKEKAEQHKWGKHIKHFLRVLPKRLRPLNIKSSSESNEKTNNTIYLIKSIKIIWRMK